jgi:iron-sulfur cluster repair protein YtfE (RIC family)
VYEYKHHLNFVTFVLDNFERRFQSIDMRLTRISMPTGKDAALPSPVEMLRDCHARIRHFTQLGCTLAGAQGAPESEIAEASTAVFRYFKRALPLHEADENQSVFPRLRKALPPGALVREAAETMVSQHKAIDVLVAELLIPCDILRHQPERLPALAQGLQHVTGALAKIFEAHLLLEETVVFPALKESLTPKQIQEIRHEMQQRRRPQRRTIHLVR